jgi:ubiquinone/menaquinone biosynthesis C-methylase UbiE
MTSSPDQQLQTVAAYDAGAAAYARHSQDRKPLRPLHERFASLLAGGARVLDIGCGPGHDAAELASLGLSVTGLDPASGLLAEARSYACLAGRLIQGDARHLPIAASRYDGIWCCASLLHVPKRDVGHALAEAFRILKSGGVLFTSMSEGQQRGAVSVHSDGLGPRDYYYHRQETWAALVAGAGFEIVDHHVQRESGNLNPGSTGWIETFARKP